MLIQWPVGRPTQKHQRDCKGIARKGYQTPGQGWTWGEWDKAEQPFGREGSNSPKAVFQPYWEKPTVRHEWRGLWKLGQ